MNPATFDEFARSFARLRCEKQLACDLGAERPTLDECLVEMLEGRAQWAQARERIEYGVMRYDRDAAASCLRLLENSPACAAHAVEVDCSSASLVGTVAAGEPCDVGSTFTCEPGTRCVLPEGLLCGTCRPIVGGELGAPCDTESACLPSDEGVVVCRIDPADARRECALASPGRLVAAGGRCDERSGLACEVGSSCRGGTCIPWLASGEECSMTLGGSCDDGAQCVQDATSSSGQRCRPLRLEREAGAPCGNVGDEVVRCVGEPDRLQCDLGSNTCIVVEPRRLGESCAEDRPCEAGLRCTRPDGSGFRECALPFPDGEACASPSECGSGFCSPTRSCGHPAKVGSCGL